VLLHVEFALLDIVDALPTVRPALC
jgi:hypothetical protein